MVLLMFVHICNKHSIVQDFVASSDGAANYKQLDTPRLTLPCLATSIANNVTGSLWSQCCSSVP